MLNINDWKIGTKLMGGFLLVVAVLVIVGGMGYLNITTMSAKTDEIIEAAPLADAAMEMKISVARDMQMIMELLAAEDQQSLDEVWKEHEGFAKNFAIFLDAILSGALVEGVQFYAAKDERLKEVAKRADAFHNDKFQPTIKAIYDSSIKIFELQQKLGKAMEGMESGYNQIIAESAKLEETVEKSIKQQIDSGISAKEIYATSGGWMDGAMEIKSVIAASRIAIEEYVQTSDAQEMATFAKKL